MARTFSRKVESAKIVNFDKVGDSYEGVLVVKKEVQRPDKDVAVLYQYHPGDPKTGEVNEEVTQGFWASELLTDLMDSMVSPGDYFRVTFKSEKKSNIKGQNPTKLYCVELAD